MEDTENTPKELEDRIATYRAEVSAQERQRCCTLTQTLTELNDLARFLCEPDASQERITACLSACQSRVDQMEDFQQSLFRLGEKTYILAGQSEQYLERVQSTLISLNEKIQSLENQHGILETRKAATQNTISRLGQWQNDTDKYMLVAGVKNYAKATKWRSVSDTCNDHGISIMHATLTLNQLNKASAWTILLGIGILTTPITYARKKYVSILRHIKPVGLTNS